MLANIRISTIYNSLTVFIVFFTILSWYSKVETMSHFYFNWLLIVINNAVENRCNAS